MNHHGIERENLDGMRFHGITRDGIEILRDSMGQD